MADHAWLLPHPGASQGKQILVGLSVAAMGSHLPMPVRFALKRVMATRFHFRRPIMHKTRTDLFSRAPAHVQRQLHDLRKDLREKEQANDRKRRALRAAEAFETWEELKSLTIKIGGKG